MLYPKLMLYMCKYSGRWSGKERYKMSSCNILCQVPYNERKSWYDAELLRLKKKLDSKLSITHQTSSWSGSEVSKASEKEYALNHWMVTGLFQSLIQNHKHEFCNIWYVRLDMWEIAVSQILICKGSLCFWFVCICNYIAVSLVSFSVHFLEVLYVCLLRSILVAITPAFCFNILSIMFFKKIVQITPI